MLEAKFRDDPLTIIDGKDFSHQNVNIRVLVLDKVTNVAKEKRANVIFTVDFGHLLD